MSQQLNTVLTDDRFADLLASSTEMSKRAAEQHKRAKEQETQLTTLAPEVADELIKFACIAPDQKDEAIRTLTDPVKTLQLVKKLASFHLTKEGLGQPANPNQPSTPVQTNQYGIPKSAALIEAESVLLQKSKDWSTSRPVK